MSMVTPWPNSATRGTTMVFSELAAAEHWEPNAPPPVARTMAMYDAHEHGLRTWVSLEPVIDVKQTLHLIDMMYPYVDKWKVGKLNHNKALEDTIDWYDFLMRVTAKLDAYGCDYMIKHALHQAASEGRPGVAR